MGKSNDFNYPTPSFDNPETFAGVLVCFNVGMCGVLPRPHTWMGGCEYVRALTTPVKYRAKGEAEGAMGEEE